MRAECSARVFQRRNKRIYTQIIIICRFWRKLSVVSLPFKICRRLNAPFTALCMQKRGTRVFQLRSKPRHPANRNHSSILSKIKRCFSPVWDISTFKRTFHCIMHAKTWYTRLPASKYAQTHANRNHLPILTKIKSCFSPVWDISTF